MASESDAQLVARDAGRRRHLAWGLAALGLLATLGLGRWQLDRAAQKEAISAAWQAREHEPLLVGAAALPRDAATALAQAYRRVRLQGVWDAAHTVYLDNRPLGERAGFWVYTPLRLGEAQGAAAPRDAVLVQRGWIPRHAEQRETMAPFRTEGGPIELVGHLGPFPGTRMALGPEAAGPIRQNLDPTGLAAATGLELRPVLVVQDDDGLDTPGADGLIRAWERPRSDVHKHYAYAAQWFAMAALILAYVVWSARRAAADAGEVLRDGRTR